MPVQDRQFKEAFNNLKKAAKEHLNAINEFKDFEDKYFGITFNSTDDCTLIDGLQFGLVEVGFEEYISIMKEYKKGGK